MGWVSELPPPPPPRGVGGLLAAAFRLYGRWWRTLVPVTAVATVPLSLLQEAVARRSGLAEPGAGPADPLTAGEAWAALIALLLSVVGSGAAQGAVTWAATRAVCGRGTSIPEAYRVGVSRLGTVLLAGILAGLAILLGLIALIVPGLVLLVRFSLFLPAAVVERARARRALARSFDLVRGRSWPVAGALVVGALVVMLIGAPLLAIGEVSASWVVRGLLSGLVTAITTPITTLILVLLYVDLRQRKEGLTLAALEAELDAPRVGPPA